MKFECVIVSVNYGDYLAWTLPLNLRHFDKIVVVTTFTDQQTQDLCKFYDVECVTTHSFYQNNARFKKSCGVNEGLARLKRDAWVAHMDADNRAPATRARDVGEGEPRSGLPIWNRSDDVRIIRGLVEILHSSKVPAPRGEHFHQA